MSESNYLSINAPNIITITIMWLVGMFLIGMIAAAVRYASSGGVEVDNA